MPFACVGRNAIGTLNFQFNRLFAHHLIICDLCTEYLQGMVSVDLSVARFSVPALSTNVGCCLLENFSDFISA